MEPVVLRYGNTNTYCLSGENGGLLIDTDYAGTMGVFSQGYIT